MSANMRNQTDTIVEKVFDFFQSDQPSNVEGNEIIEVLSQQISVNPESAGDIMDELAIKFANKLEQICNQYE
ncbi:hypothetical protein M3Y14_34200 (plasmid) [Bacillus thuringiensis]|uniref:hypothetical protein n=1 Tax=Bacillus thuringiensis TaxID=1428 RepID=UPI0022254EED|nr:hypothetical protein [Bacillus thuringiensis]UYX56035.1 hypothetical protein M3Y14_34200 [Bacillus thuringiensis]